MIERMKTSLSHSTSDETGDPPQRGQPGCPARDLRWRLAANRLPSAPVTNEGRALPS
jgi:hypothetical protein